LAKLVYDGSSFLLRKALEFHYFLNDKECAMQEIFMVLARSRQRQYCSYMPRIILVFTDESHISFGIPRLNEKAIGWLAQTVYRLTKGW